MAGELRLNSAELAQYAADRLLARTPDAQAAANTRELPLAAPHQPTVELPVEPTVELPVPTTVPIPVQPADTEPTTVVVRRGVPAKPSRPRRTADPRAPADQGAAVGAG